MLKKFMAVTLLVVMFLSMAPRAYDGEYTGIVETTKTILTAQHKDLSGACGAFQVTGRVAYQLKDKGFKLLRKAGGNRAIILTDGSCVDGDHGSGPGYATDYLISVTEGFVGYDLLGDGGGANNPQWIGPEGGAETIDRNMKNFAEPFPMDAVTPPVVIPPVIVPPVVPPSSDPLIGEKLDLIIANVAANREKEEQEHQQIVAEVKENRRTLTDALKFISKYILPAVSGWFIHQAAQ